MYKLQFMQVLPPLCYIVQSLNATIEKEMHIQKIRQIQSYTKSVPLWWKKLVPDDVMETIRDETHDETTFCPVTQYQ